MRIWRRNSRTPGVDGKVVPFIANMAEAFAQADLVVAALRRRRCQRDSRRWHAFHPGSACRSQPTTISARTPKLWPNAGAARMVLDRDMNGERLFQELSCAAF